MRLYNAMWRFRSVYRSATRWLKSVYREFNGLLVYLSYLKNKRCFHRPSKSICFGQKKKVLSDSRKKKRENQILSDSRKKIARKPNPLYLKNKRCFHRPLKSIWFGKKSPVRFQKKKRENQILSDSRKKIT